MDKPSEPVPDYIAANAASPPPGLTHEQYAEIQKVQVRLKKIQRAIGVAKFDAGMTATFAVFGILTFCMGWENVVIGVLLGGIAINGFRGLRLLQKYDSRAPGILMMNQLYLATIIILYAIYALYRQGSGESDLSKQMAAAGIPRDMLGGLPELVPLLNRLVYGTLIFGTILMQGLTALYYRTRQKYVDAYLQQTPQWVIDLQKLQKH